MTERTEPVVSTLSVRIGQEEAHFGGDLVDGARVLGFSGDVVTEVAITTDGDEGLFVGYDEVEFLAPVHTGDFPEITGTVTQDRHHQPHRAAGGRQGHRRPVRPEPLRRRRAGGARRGRPGDRDRRRPGGTQPRTARRRPTSS